MSNLGELGLDEVTESKTWGNRKFRFDPGFKAVKGTRDQENGNIGRGRGGERQYYTRIDKETGAVTVYRAGQFRNDDILGTYDKNGEFQPAIDEGNGKPNATKSETEYFKNNENADKIIKTSERIASDEWEKAGKPTPPGDPYEKIYNKPRPEGDGGEGDIQDLSDITSKAATIKARKKYSTTLEFPTGITDFFQDKLRISVLKFEPAETGGDLFVDKIKMRRLGGIVADKNLTEVRIEGGSPFQQQRGALANKIAIGAVVLPIPDGVTDANLVTYGEDKLNPLQLAGANIALKTLLNKGSMDGGDAFARLDEEDSDGDIPIIGLTGAGYWDFREFGGIPADKSSNSNQSDVNFVVPSTADSGNMYTVIAEFQKIY